MPRVPPGAPPPERRCTATIKGKRRNIGQQCTRWALPGGDVCNAHKSGAWVPSHDPPPERRCHGLCIDAEGHRTRPCKLWAIRGLTVCYRHGGAPEHARAAGRRRMAEDKVEKKARALAEVLGADPIDNPLSALAQVAGEAMRFKDVLQQMVSELETVSTKGLNGEQVRPQVTVYERALDRAGGILEKIARLNIDERLAAINEKQAETVIRAIDAALEYAGVTGDAADGARKVAARLLRAA
jgi:hypothetical protein